MVHPVQDVHLRSLRVEKHTVTRLETRRARVQATLQNAQHVYGSAGAVVRHLEAEIADINEELLAATSRLLAVRDAYRRDAVARLPDDIVRCIFEQACPARPPSDIMDMQPGSCGTFDRKLAEHTVSLPFALASVCGQWRNVALEMSALWSFIHVLKTTRGHLRRVQLLLERSKSTPLDIAFHADEGNPDMRGAILDALLEHVYRWSYIQQSYLIRPDDFAIVRRQAPHLRGLVLALKRDHTPGHPRFLSQSSLWLGPDIEELVLISPWILMPKAPYVLPRLVLLIWSQPGAHYLWQIIYAARDTLKDLSFGPVSDPFDIFTVQPPALPGPFTLRSLEQLHIHTLAPQSASQFNVMNASRLKTVSFSTHAHALAMEPFAEVVRSTVKTLIIHSTLAHDALPPLSKLSNVEHLLFAKATTVVKLMYKVSDAFFADLSAPVDQPGLESPAWIWPHLSTVSLSTRGSFEAGTGQNFLQFVRSRTGTDLDNSSTPRRLTRVDIEDKTSPVWLRDEVNLMLA